MNIYLFSFPMVFSVSYEKKIPLEKVDLSTSEAHNKVLTANSHTWKHKYPAMT